MLGRDSACKGRALEPSDDQRGTQPHVVLSYSLWQRRFGGAADTVGSTLMINNRAMTVAGIMPASFFGTRLDAETPEIWAPLAFEPMLTNIDAMDHPSEYWLYVIGRAQPGIKPAGYRCANQRTARGLAPRASGIAPRRAERRHRPAAHRMDTRGERHQRAARHLCLRTATAADDCRLRAADRLRQSGEPDVGARHGAPAADRGVSRAGGAAQPSGPADAGGEPGGGACRQCRGSAAFGLRLARHAGDGAEPARNRRRSRPRFRCPSSDSHWR